MSTSKKRPTPKSTHRHYSSVKCPTKAINGDSGTTIAEELYLLSKEIETPASKKRLDGMKLMLDYSRVYHEFLMGYMKETQAVSESHPAFATVARMRANYEAMMQAYEALVNQTV